MIGVQSFAYQGAAAIYAAGWLALLLAPLRPKFCWIFARSGAVLLASGYLGLLVYSNPSNELLRFFLTSQDSAEIQLVAIASLSLFVGSWQVEDAPQHGIPHMALLPCLILTALTGPIGFAVHIGLRDFFKWRSRNR